MYLFSTKYSMILLIYNSYARSLLLNASNNSAYSFYAASFCAYYSIDNYFSL